MDQPIADFHSMTTFIITALIASHIAAFAAGALVFRNNSAKAARIEAKAKAAAAALRE